MREYVGGKLKVTTRKKKPGTQHPNKQEEKKNGTLLIQKIGRKGGTERNKILG